MTEEFGICSDTVVPGPPPECPALDPGLPAHSPDLCNCNGLTCPADQACRASEEFCSCGPRDHNVCVEQPCSTSADCGDDVCVPTPLLFGKRCITPKCRSDADCADAVGKACVVLVQLPPQAGDPYFEGVQCMIPR